MPKAKVAWVTHTSLFTGYIGGAEMADEAMIRRAPVGVNVTVMHPQNLPDDLESYDRVVISGMVGLDIESIERLIAMSPVSWLHHQQEPMALLRWLYEGSSYVVTLTPQHEEIERRWLPNARFAMNPGWFDTTECVNLGKSMDALWSHRDVWHKGLELAKDWAQKNDADLTILTDAPRMQVLNMMAIHRRFVLLSEIFDAGPRSVMEAQLSGCELVVNENVGWFDEPVPQLRKRIEAADTEFWRLVCE